MIDAPDNGAPPLPAAAPVPWRQGLALAAGVAALDQAAKWWVLNVVMTPPRVIEVTPFFNLVLGWNRGVSFGLFNSDSPVNDWLLPLVTAAITIALVVWMIGAGRRPVALALGLVVGGALGNLIDRLRFGAVADYLDFHAFGYHWPAFNVADTGIAVGAMALVFDSLFVADEKP